MCVCVCIYVCTVTCHRRLLLLQVGQHFSSHVGCLVSMVTQPGGKLPLLLVQMLVETLAVLLQEQDAAAGTGQSLGHAVCTGRLSVSTGKQVCQKEAYIYIYILGRSVEEEKNKSLINC